MQLIMLLMISISANDGIDLAEFISIENDIKTYKKLQECIKKIKTGETLEPGIEVNEGLITIQGHNRPDLFTFSSGLVSFFDYFQRGLKRDPEMQFSRWNKLRSLGMGGDDMNMFKFLLESMPSPYETIENNVEDYQSKGFQSLREKLKSNKISNRKKNLSEVTKFLQSVEEQRVIEIRGWSYDLLKYFSKQGQFAIAMFIQEVVIPGTAATHRIDANAYIPNRALDLLMSDAAKGQRIVK